MSRNSEIDFWKEMAIREVANQCRFAQISYQNIFSKALVGTDITFSSIHSFLSHVAMVSKLLKSDDQPDRGSFKRKIYRLLQKINLLPKTISIEKVLDISRNSVIHNRKFRNALEHYDEELKQWIKEHGLNANIGTNNIGPKHMLSIPNMVWVTHYDPNTNVFTFVNKDLDLNVFYAEILGIKTIAEEWLARADNNDGFRE